MTSRNEKLYKAPVVKSKSIKATRNKITNIGKKWSTGKMFKKNFFNYSLFNLRLFIKVNLLLYIIFPYFLDNYLKYAVDITTPDEWKSKVLSPSCGDM